MGGVGISWETRTLSSARAPEATGGGVYDRKVSAIFDDRGAHHVISRAEAVGDYSRRAQALRGELAHG